LFVNFVLCTATDFSGEDKASGVKFCTVVYRRPGPGIGLSNFGERCSPRSAKSDQSGTHPEVKFRVGRARVIACHINISRVDVGSTCVEDIRSSPKTVIRVFVFCLCVCTVADHSAEDKASGVKFCTAVNRTAVNRRPGQGMSHFGELCSLRSPKSEESARCGKYCR